MNGFARTIVLGFILAIAALLRYYYHGAVNQVLTMPPLVIINMCKNWCGLGNQMFRYAAGLGFAARNGTRVCVFGYGETAWHPAHA